MVGSRAELVAIIDDDPSVRGALLGLMRAAGHEARGFASAEAYLESGAEERTVCLVVDIRMRGMSGLELQAQLNGRAVRIPIIFITAHGDDETRRQAMGAGALRFIQKPFDDEELLQGIREARGMA